MLLRATGTQTSHAAISDRVSWVITANSFRNTTGPTYSTAEVGKCWFSGCGAQKNNKSTCCLHRANSQLFNHISPLWDIVGFIGSLGKIIREMWLLPLLYLSAWNRTVISNGITLIPSPAKQPELHSAENKIAASLTEVISGHVRGEASQSSTCMHTQAQLWVQRVAPSLLSTCLCIPLSMHVYLFPTGASCARTKR